MAGEGGGVVGMSTSWEMRIVDGIGEVVCVRVFVCESSFDVGIGPRCVDVGHRVACQFVRQFSGDDGARR
jgi:hypothetical protein